MYIPESENLLHYGKVLSINNKVMNDGRYRTIRKISYEGKLYNHCMMDGKIFSVVEVKEKWK